MITVTKSEAKSRREELAGLKAACKRHGITQERIALVAKVTRPLVVNVFAGRTTSGRVVETAKRLVVQAGRRARKAKAGRQPADCTAPDLRASVKIADSGWEKPPTKG